MSLQQKGNFKYRFKNHYEFLEIENRKNDYFEKNNLSKSLGNSKQYEEICHFYKTYKVGTRLKKFNFQAMEGSDDEDFQNPIRLRHSSVDLNDTACIYFFCKNKTCKIDQRFGKNC